MAGPFSRIGINSAPSESDDTPVEATQTGQGVIFGPTDVITVDQADPQTGTIDDQGVIFGPELETTPVNVDPETGEVENPGVIFGPEFVPSLSPTGGGDGVVSVDAEFNAASRDLTITVNDLSDTVNIPGRWRWH